MLLADGLVEIVVGLLVLGVIVLLLAAMALVTRCLKLVFRAVTGNSRGRCMAGRRGGRLVCPEPRCGHANPSVARYCARCGRPFGHEHDLDAYG